MKSFSQCLLFMGLVVFGCQKDDIPKGIPDCIINLINEIKQQDKWEPPAKVFRYQYKGKTVYYIPQRCCDIPSTLMDDQCTVLCAPDGGFSGSGDGKCTDFFDARTNAELIWQDSR